MTTRQELTLGLSETGRKWETVKSGQYSFPSLSLPLYALSFSIPHFHPSLFQHYPHPQALISPTGPHPCAHITTDTPSVGWGKSICSPSPARTFYPVSACRSQAPSRPTVHLFPLVCPQLHPHRPWEPRQIFRVNTFPIISKQGPISVSRR